MTFSWTEISSFKKLLLLVEHSGRTISITVAFTVRKHQTFSFYIMWEQRDPGKGAWLHMETIPYNLYTSVPYLPRRILSCAISPWYCLKSSFNKKNKYNQYISNISLSESLSLSLLSQLKRLTGTRCLCVNSPWVRVGNKATVGWRKGIVPMNVKQHRDWMQGERRVRNGTHKTIRFRQ